MPLKKKNLIILNPCNPCLVVSVRKRGEKRKEKVWMGHFVRLFRIGEVLFLDFPLCFYGVFL